MAANTIRILDPFSPPRAAKGEAAARVGSMRGKTLGLLSNGWRSFDVMLAHIAGEAVQRQGVGAVVSRKNPNSASTTPKATMEELAANTDAVVVGVGH